MSPRRKDVQLTRPAVKDLAAIPPVYREAIDEALTALAHDAHAGIPLKGPRQGQWKYRIGPYRVTYQFDEYTVHVLSIQHRKDVYR